VKVVGAVIVLVVFGCARERTEISRVRPPVHPSIILRSPAIHTTIPWNTAISIKAEVRDLVGAVVEFTAAGQVIARDGTAPYEVSYRPNLPGPLVIGAQVRNAHGNVIASDAVPVTVVNPDPRTSTDELSIEDLKQENLRNDGHR